MNDAGINYMALAQDQMLVDDPREKRLIEFVFRAHWGQIDKVGAPYHHHLYRVAELVDTDLRVVAYAHDILEDTKTTEADLYDVGFTPWEVNTIKLLTHYPHEANDDYLLRVRSQPEAVIIKLADLADNLSRNRMVGLDRKTQERLKKKYYRALCVLSGVE